MFKKQPASHHIDFSPPPVLNRDKVTNALTILFSFGALMVAHHQGVFSIGAVMSLGMIASAAAFLLFLPALLTLWGKR